METDDSFLRTKLFIPPVGPDIVIRDRLATRINEGIQRSLTFISAPAGYGKTTLLANWAKGCGMPVAWVSLDEGDNEPVRFLTYLVTALENALPEPARRACRSILSVLQSPRPFSLQSVLAMLINELSTAPYKTILILDDYQLLTNQAIHDAVTFLLEHKAEGLHLIISTRSDPPLPLPRLRARRQLVEIRTADMQFTEEEAAQFLNQVMGFSLSKDDIARLENRTEGWIAGLQMAALSLQGRLDRSRFIQTFSGSHRYIMEFLFEEVFDRQPLEIQSFLLQTSLLPRMCASLCDAIREENEHSANPQPSTYLLEKLERANLFLIPLDDEQRWYRYHHLFADLLQVRLCTSTPELIPIIHKRASLWYEEHDSETEAIRHALEAKDFESAARLLDTNASRILYRGEFANFRKWFESIPVEVLYRRPRLCVFHAMGLSLAGHTEDVEKWLQVAERVVPGNSLSPETQALTNQILTIRVHLSDMVGDVPRTVELACQANRSLPENDLANRTVVAGMLGHARFLNGDLDEAADSWSTAVKHSVATENFYGVMVYTAQLAKVCKIKGQLRKACELYQQALRFMAAQGVNQPYVLGSIYIGLGDVKREWNSLEEARQLLLQGIGQSEIFEIPTPVISGYAVLIRVLISLGEIDLALEAQAKGMRLIKGTGIWGDVCSQFEASLARLWLANGDLPEARRWASDRHWMDSSPVVFSREPEMIALARIWMAEAEYGKAASLLNYLTQAAESGGRFGSLIEILALQALCFQAEGEPSHALPAINHSLSMAEPEGYMRLFVDEGEPMKELLKGTRSRLKVGQLRDYVDRLLLAYKTGGPPTSGPSILNYEPLSERELEILRHICEGVSNREIAEKLYITLNTVKKHNSTIFGKLGVDNRAQAILRAQQLGLVPGK